MVIEDDTGRIHGLYIKDTYLMEHFPNQILSPQHFAQVLNNHILVPEGTGTFTNNRNIILFLGQRKFTKTIPLDKQLNIRLTWTAPYNEEFKAYMAKNPSVEMDNKRTFISHIIPEEG